MTKYTALFWVRELDTDQRELSCRCFIGTQEEALDELKEELKTFYPDEYDRKDKYFWGKRRMELSLSDTHSTQVVGHDMGKTKIIRVERISSLKEEEE